MTRILLLAALTLLSACSSFSGKEANITSSAQTAQAQDVDANDSQANQTVAQNSKKSVASTSEKTRRRLYSLAESNGSLNNGYNKIVKSEDRLR